MNGVKGKAAPGLARVEEGTTPINSRLTGGPLVGGVVRIPQGCAHAADGSISAGEFCADTSFVIPGTVRAFKEALAADCRESQKSREQICGEMSEILGYRVRESSLDAWVALGKRNQIPGSLVSTWVAVTGSRRVLELVCPSGLAVVPDVERTRARIGARALDFMREVMAVSA